MNNSLIFYKKALKLQYAHSARMKNDLPLKSQVLGPKTITDAVIGRIAHQVPIYSEEWWSSSHLHCEMSSERNSHFQKTKSLVQCRVVQREIKHYLVSNGLSRNQAAWVQTN